MMVSRREFEQDRAKKFVFDLFWALDLWVNSLESEIYSLKKEKDRIEAVYDRKELETLLRHGFGMRVSQLSLIVDGAYRRQFISAKPTDQEEWLEICLNDAIAQRVYRHNSAFEKMGTSVVVAESPRVAAQFEFEGGGPAIMYIVWWMLDAWPDGQIAVDFVVDEKKVRIIFQDPDRVHTEREYVEGHGNLFVWSCLIEYLTVVECHGWCAWPKPEEPRRLEIILPLRPPTAEELDAPLPEWMK